MTATACNISVSISSLEIQVHMHLHCVMCSHDIGHAQKRPSSAHHVTLALRFDWCMQQPRSNPVRCKLVKRLKHSNNYVYEKYSFRLDNRLLLEQKFRLMQNLGTKLIAINTAPSPTHLLHSDELIHDVAKGFKLAKEADVILPSSSSRKHIDAMLVNQDVHVHVQGTCRQTNMHFLKRTALAPGDSRDKC